MQTSAAAQQHAQIVPPAADATPALVVLIEKLIVWIGSPASLALHTTAFVGFFATAMSGLVSWDQMFLVLTTIVSLEAIYLSIFIQMSVNRQAQSLKGVEEDVESLQENVEEIKEDVEEIQEDVEDIQEEIGEITEDDDEDEDLRKKKQAEMLEALTNDVRAMLRHIEALKSRQH